MSKVKIKQLEKIRNNYETKMTKYGLAFLDGEYWKVITSNGHIKLLHIVVYEREIGHIPKDFVVHHIDYNPENNSPDNLISMSKSEHGRLHLFDYNNAINKAKKFEV